MNLEKDTWSVINNYFETNPKYITKHHLDSYNDFVNNKIYDIFNDTTKNPQTVVLIDKENDEITYYINVYYGGRKRDQVNLSRPVIYDALKDQVKPMYPNEARLKNLTYAFNIFCDVEVEYIIKNKDEVIFQEWGPFNFKDINIGRVPIMLHSTLCSLSGLSNEALKKVGECPYEHGGYFIINGREKVCISRERKAENNLYINKSSHPDFSYSAEVKSSPAEFRYARNTYINVIEATKEIMIENPYFNSGRSDSGSKYIPLFVMFRVLGVETDKEILEYIFHDLNDDFAKQGLRLLYPSIDNQDNKEIFDQMSALHYLEKFIRKMNEGESVDIQRNRAERYAIIFKSIYDNLFPHIGRDFRDKALYLGYCVNQLLQVMLGIREDTDRDNFEFKRVDLSGFMIANLFRDGFQQLQYDVRNKISSSFEFGYIELKGSLITNMVNEGTIKTMFSSSSTEEVVMKGFQTGTLYNPGKTSSKKGVIQQLDRRGFYSYLGQIRILVTPNDSGARVPIGRRHLHSTQYGYLCPMTIKDGSDVGIKKYFTCLAQVTAGSPTEPLKKAIMDGGLIPLCDLHTSLLYKQTKVFLNGNWIGVHTDPSRLLEWMRLLRRNGLINIYTSISWKIKEDTIFIMCDGGRCTRPVYIVEDNKPTITEKMIRELKAKGRTFLDLVVGMKVKTKKVPYIHNDYYHPHEVGYSKIDTLEDLKANSGVIEYLDNNDMNNVIITSSLNLDSKFVDYTHMELHESMMFSLEAQGFPFVEHNDIVRNVFAIGQQCKQSASLYATNYRHKIETTGFVLSHPQKPLTNTRLGKHIYNDRLGHGQQIVVAICSYTGYNQEDSTICCQDSIDLGLLKISYFKGYEQTEVQDTKTGTFEFFYNPETQAMREDAEDIKQKEYNDYTQLDNFGFIKEGTYCKKGDEIVIGKYVKLTNTDEPPRDISVEIKGKGETIDKVFTCYTDDTKTKLVKIRTVKERKPIIGDKIGSRHGQKGVLGITLSRSDMPHTKSGIRPDIIINPAAFPKRKTNGHLIETVYAKLAALLGLVGDGTAFVPKNMNDIAKKLAEYGFEGHSEEILYDGFTGQQMGSTVFIGPVFYQRFKQMVDDKIHSRASGARNEEDLSTMGGGYTARERQPYAGRALGGGGRIGEMERDSIVAHGISYFLKESMMERSDKYYTHVCEKSGRLAVVNESENLFMSPDVDGPLSYDIIETLDLDKNSNENKGKELTELLGPNTFNQNQTEFFRAYMPYCAKLLIQECEGMGLSVKLRSSNSQPILEEKREKSNHFKEMIDSHLTNQQLVQDEDYKELESLKEFLKDRYTSSKIKADDNEEDDKKEDDDEKDKKNRYYDVRDEDLEETGFTDLSGDENETENKEELEEKELNYQQEKYGSIKRQRGGSDDENLKDYLKDDLMELENEDLMKSNSFSQKGGSYESIPFDMTNINEMGQNLLSDSNPNLSAQGGSMSSSLMNTDRPYFQPQPSQHQQPPQQPSQQPQQQSGGTVEPAKSDIKIINLDVDYKMKEQDAFSQSSQSGGTSQQQPNTQQQAGSINNVVKPIDPKGFIPIADNMKPTFEAEIFI